MAVPKRKTSKAIKRKRRTHFKATVATTVSCTNCGAYIQPHIVCRDCGFYKGVEVKRVKDN